MIFDNFANVFVLKVRGRGKPDPKYLQPPQNRFAPNTQLPEEHDGISYDPGMAALDVTDFSSYSANHALWTAYASALVYAHPDVIRHVVQDIWGTILSSSIEL